MANDTEAGQDLSDRQPAPATAAQRRSRPLSERKKRTYRGLIMLVIDLLERKGFDDVSVRELAELAGIAPMTIHNVFGSKEALFSAAIDYRTRQFIHDAPTGGKHGFDALLAANAEVVARAIASNQLMRSVAGMLARDTSLFSVRRIYRAFHCRHVREMKEAGLLLPEADPAMITMMMMISHNAAINSWVNDEIDDETVAALFDLQACNALHPVAEPRARAEIDACYRDRMTRMTKLDVATYFDRSRPPGRFDVALLSDED